MNFQQNCICIATFLAMAGTSQAATLVVLDDYTLNRINTSGVATRVLETEFPDSGGREVIDSEVASDPDSVRISREESNGFYSATSLSFGNFTQEDIPQFGSEAAVGISDAGNTQMEVVTFGQFEGRFAKGADTIPFRISGTSLEIGGHTLSNTSVAQATLDLSINVVPVDGSLSSSAQSFGYSGTLTGQPTLLAGGGSAFTIQAGTGPAKLYEAFSSDLPLTGTFEAAAATNFEAEPWAKYTFDVFEDVIDVSDFAVGEEFDIYYSWFTGAEANSDNAYARATFFDPQDTTGSFIDLSGHTAVSANGGGTTDPTPPDNGGTVTPVPVPASLLFMMSAVLGLGAMRRRRA